MFTVLRILFFCFIATFFSPMAMAKQELILAHTVKGGHEQALKNLVQAFNTQNLTHPITLREYTPGIQADFYFFDADETSKMPAVRPLWQVMKSGGHPLQATNAYSNISSALADSNGRLLALPAGLSTPITFYNRDMLEQAGIDMSKPPQTWQDWQAVLGTLYSKGVCACPYTTAYPSRIFLDNSSAWNNQAFSTGSGKNEKLSINGLMQVKHLALMSTWYKARYLKIFGRGAEAEDKFASGECAVLTTRSSSLPYLQSKVRFKLGAAPLPYHAGAYGAPQNTLADGEALWIGKRVSSANDKTIVQFVRFWLDTPNQNQWQTESGYLPLTPQGKLANAFKTQNDETKIQQFALDQLLTKSPTLNSRACVLRNGTRVRLLMDEALENIWNNLKTPKEALDDVVTRFKH